MNGELYHWSLRRGEERKDHKYKRRELIGTKQGKNIYRYYYNELKDKANDFKKEIKSINDKPGKKPNVGAGVAIVIKKETLDNLADKGKSFVNNIFNKNSDERSKEAERDKEYWDYQRKQMEESRNNPIQSKKSPDYKYLARVKNPSTGEYRYFYDEKELKAYYENNGDPEEKDLANKYKLKDKSTTPDQDMKEINERYSESLDYQMNCYSCSIAYDLRRRGFDVEALADNDGSDPESVLEVYDDIDSDGFVSDVNFLDAESETDVLYSYMEQSFEDEARGLFVFIWLSGSGHVINWEKRNGKLEFRDCQNGKIYSKKEMAELLSVTARICYIRTDNKKLNSTASEMVRQN